MTSMTSSHHNIADVQCSGSAVVCVTCCGLLSMAVVAEYACSNRTLQLCCSFISIFCQQKLRAARGGDAVN